VGLVERETKGVNAEIEAAFERVSRGFSEDRVIADPELNQQFIESCRSLGLTQEPVVLNTALLNLRKRGLRQRTARSRQTRFSNTEDFRFAAEIAARHLEQRHHTTLDRVLCDPNLAAQLDSVAEQLAPGHTSLEYRWAALRLRKTSRLKPELVLRVAKIKTADFGPVEQITVQDLPDKQGVYIFYSTSETLYVGEASNLRKRVAKHLDHSDRKALAHWLWTHGVKDLQLEVLALPDSFDTLARLAVERELIMSRRPIFNIQR
jgi:hypothetical protein